MSVYHLTVKKQSRSRGQSAVAKAAYNSGALLSAPGVVADYRRKCGVVWATLLGPDKPRSEFWAGIEDAERRADACLSRELEIALPVELDRDQRIALCNDFGAAVRERYSLAGVDLAMHEPPPWNRRKRAKREHENPHLHLLMPDRDAGGQKLTVTVPDQKGRPHKVRAFDRKQGPQEIRALRRLWADMCNAALRAAGHPEAVITETSIATLDAALERHERSILAKLAALEARREEVASATATDGSRPGQGSRAAARAACGGQEGPEERAEARSETSRPAGEAGSGEERGRGAADRGRVDLTGAGRAGDGGGRPGRDSSSDPCGLIRDGASSRDSGDQGEPRQSELPLKRSHTEDEWAAAAAALGLEPDDQPDGPAPNM